MGYCKLKIMRFHNAKYASMGILVSTTVQHGKPFFLSKLVTSRFHSDSFTELSLILDAL